MKKTLLLFLFILANSFYAQEYIFGKITSEQNIELSGVLILNTRTDEKAYSDSDGNFMISAKNNDALRFVKQKYDRITYSVKPEDFKNSIKITLIKSVVEIEEVEIKSKLTGNLREDARRVESVKKVKLNKEISKYIAEKSDPLILKPKAGEFVQPVGQGFSI